MKLKTPITLEMFKPSLINGSVVDRGLAEPDGSGHLQLSARGYATLDRLQTEYRNRKRQSAESRGNLNQRWSGEILSNLAELTVDKLLSGVPIAGEKVVRDMWSSLKQLGHDVTLRQVRYGLSIIGKEETPEGIWQAAKNHRSYGDWWNSLSDEQRDALMQKRKASHFYHLKSLPAQERAALRAKVSEELMNCAERSSAPEQGAQVRQLVQRALERDIALKSLEEGQSLATGISYQGVEEKMRSSWEAMYARAVTQKPDRFYIYEPMGFPLIDPTTGRIEAYHPDFLVCTNTVGHGVRSKLIEIKGYLTETGQRKIALFQQYYIRGDFSGAPEARRALLVELVQTAKEKCQRHFGLELGPHTQFRVYGELPWNRESNNFDVSIHGGRGFISRLRALCPHLCPEGVPPRLSNTERQRYSKKISGGNDTGKLVAPLQTHGARIQTSSEVVIDSGIAVTMLMHLVGIREELYKLKIDPIIVRCAITQAANVSQLLLTWHGYSERSNKASVASLFEQFTQFEPKRSTDRAFALGVSIFVVQGLLELVQSAGRVGTTVTPTTQTGTHKVLGILDQLAPIANELSTSVATFTDGLKHLPPSTLSALLEGTQSARSALQRYYDFSSEKPSQKDLERRYGFEIDHAIKQASAAYKSIHYLESSPGKPLISTL